MGQQGKLALPTIRRGEKPGTRVGGSAYWTLAADGVFDLTLTSGTARLVEQPDGVYEIDPAPAAGANSARMLVAGSTVLSF